MNPQNIALYCQHDFYYHHDGPSVLETYEDLGVYIYLFQSYLDVINLSIQYFQSYIAVLLALGFLVIVILKLFTWSLGYIPFGHYLLVCLVVVPLDFVALYLGDSLFGPYLLLY